MVEASVDEGEAKASAASLHLHGRLLHLLPWDALGCNTIFVGMLLSPKTAPKYDLATSWTVRRLLGCYERTCMTPTLVESERADVVNQACHALATTILLAFFYFGCCATGPHHNPFGLLSFGCCASTGWASPPSPQPFAGIDVNPLMWTPDHFCIHLT